MTSPMLYTTPRPPAPRYWVRRFLPERDAFVLAPIAGHGEEFLAAIDPQSPTRGRVRDLLMDSLFGDRRGQAPIRLLVRPAAAARQSDEDSAPPADCLATITDAFQPRILRDNEARKINDAQGNLVSRWTDSLDEAVTHHGQLWVAGRTLDFFSNINPTVYDRIRAQAAANLPADVAELLPTSFLNALRGGEDEGRRRRYNPALPLELQLDQAPSKPQRANYAVQRALLDELAAQLDGGPSALAEAEGELLTSGSLVASHPMRDGNFLRLQTAETARGIGSQILAGLMELNGAEPATQEFDELFTLKADGSFERRPGLHDEVLREMAPHPVAASADFTQKTAAYLELGLSRLNRYDAEARAWVLNEQKKTAVTVKPRVPDPASMPSPENRNNPKKAGRWLKAGETTATAADHAHKTMTQAEQLPFF